MCVMFYLGEVDPVLEERGLVLRVGALGSGHVELARDLRVQRGVAVVLALPADQPHPARTSALATPVASEHRRRPGRLADKKGPRSHRDAAFTLPMPKLVGGRSLPVPI